jgi:hypothetical protein
MLHALRRDERCVFCAVFKVLVQNVLPFLDESNHRGAFLAARSIVERFEDLAQTFDVSLGLLQVLSSNPARSSSDSAAFASFGRALTSRFFDVSS